MPVVKPSKNVDEFMTIMMLEGYRPHQAYGWIANAQQESYKDLRPTVLGDWSEKSQQYKSIGLFQWQHTRRIALVDYGEQMGEPWTKLMVQALFSLYEKGEGKAHRMLRNAKTLEESVDAGIQYTRPSHPNRPRRLALARALEAWYEKPAEQAKLQKKLAKRKESSWTGQSSNLPWLERLHLLLWGPNANPVPQSTRRTRRGAKRTSRRKTSARSSRAASGTARRAAQNKGW